MSDTIQQLTEETKRRRVPAMKPKKVSIEEGKIYAYKVFKRMNNGLLHSGSVPLSSKLHKVYQQGHKTEVTVEMFEAGFGICIFTDLANARSWNGMNVGTKEIWKVEVGQIREPASCRPSVKVLGEILPKDKLLKSNYRTILRKLKEAANKSSWPIGAKVADYVIPVERIE